MTLSAAAPRAAYVHVPFCRHRCGYCNFTLIAGRDELVADYLRAIELELRSLATPHEVDTLFFGGGTPTHLSPPQLDELLETGCYVGVATHDEWLIGESLARIARRGLGLLDYELQMLLGVREERRDELVSEGHRLRVYVPFGEQWYRYSLRRLQENPAMAGTIARATAGRVLRPLRP